MRFYFLMNDERSYAAWGGGEGAGLLAISSLFIELICMRRTNPRIKLFSHQREIYLRQRAHTHILTHMCIYIQTTSSYRKFISINKHFKIHVIIYYL